jgi:hypothetical protein
VQSLLCERPYHLEPGFEKPPSDMRDVTNYSDCIRHETLRVAVVDMVQDGPQHRLMPEQLRAVVRVRLCKLLLTADLGRLSLRCARHGQSRTLRHLLRASESATYRTVSNC